jgi:uncharacterized membrane protein (UPF0136 family)
MGHRIAATNSLKLVHSISTHRMTLAYLQRLILGFRMSSLYLELYALAPRGRSYGIALALAWGSLTMRVFGLPLLRFMRLRPRVPFALHGLSVEWRALGLAVRAAISGATREHDCWRQARRLIDPVEQQRSGQ